jgi:hypothetical protein
MKFSYEDSLFFKLVNIKYSARDRWLLHGAGEGRKAFGFGGVRL